MTKLIAILIIAVALYGGWRLFLYWDEVKNEEDTKKKEAAAAVVNEDNLPGVPYGLDNSLRAAKEKGADALRQWLKLYGPSIQDPRKAAIELDLCEAVFRADPAEAKRVFAAVKDRVPPSSPIWPRVNQLAKTYE